MLSFVQNLATKIEHIIFPCQEKLDEAMRKNKQAQEEFICMLNDKNVKICVKKAIDVRN